MNLKQLRNFCKVVEVGNLTKAADQLHIAQPALGQQMRQLEATFDVPLLVRHSRGVTPTKAGSLLFDRALQILQLVSETELVVASMGNRIRETVRLGVPPSIIQVLGTDLLIQARERLPDVALSLVENVSYDLVEDIENGRLDFALIFDLAGRSGPFKTAFLDEELLFVAAPQFSNSDEPITLAKVLTHKLALTGDRDLVRQLIDTAAANLGLEVPMLYEVQSFPALRDIALRGLAACIMPYGAAINEIKRGALVGRRIINPAIARTLYFLRRTNTSSFLNEAAFLILVQDMIVSFKDAVGYAQFSPDFQASSKNSLALLDI